MAAAVVALTAIPAPPLGAADGPPPLSLMARLGQRLFYDARLSGSGQLSCVSCHDPGYDYGPPDGRPVRSGGAQLDRSGLRAVPSLKYVDRTPGFRIGPDHERPDAGAVTSGLPSAAAVPSGGLFWDGRADTLQDQARGPLFSPFEMAASGPAAVAETLRSASYRSGFAALFGPRVLEDDDALIAGALFAVGRYQYEDPSFHPYDSKYDYYLNGKASLTPAEQRGLAVFEDERRGNCASCHLDKLTANGRPPAFTDYEYEALAVPRNAAIARNADPGFSDLGLCGPLRADLQSADQYCGLFKTPSLRNTARRKVYFHNGVYHELRDVLHFYARRETRPDAIYPRAADGKVLVYDDVPPPYRGNIDVTDPPFDRRRGAPPALDDAEIADLIAFLQTLSDGYGTGDPYPGRERSR